MDYYDWKPYVPVAARRRKAAREAAKLAKKGQPLSPVVDRRPRHRQDVLGQGLVRQSRALQRLCQPPAARPHLCAQRVGDRSADHAGRGQARSSAARSCTEIQVKVAAVPKPRWSAICKDCAGAIDSLVELLQGRFSKGVMERICHEQTGLFPSPAEITLHLQLSGLGLDVQARRGGALRHRRAAGREARPAVRPAQGRSAGSHRAGRQRPAAGRDRSGRPARFSTRPIFGDVRDRDGRGGAAGTHRHSEEANLEALQTLAGFVSLDRDHRDHEEISLVEYRGVRLGVLGELGGGFRPERDRDHKHAARL